MQSEFKTIFLFIASYTVICCSSTVNETQAVDGYHKANSNEGGPLDLNIDPTTLVNNIHGVCDRLRILDKVLTSMFEDPPENGGEELMKLSHTFNQACMDLLQYCSSNRQNSLEEVRTMLVSGGPKFFEVVIDENKMQERFKWGVDSVVAIHILRGRSIENWYHLQKLYDILPV